LELFAGSRSIGKAAQELGFEVFSSDLEKFEGIDYACDILEFDVTKLPWQPEVIWASPPCTGFSVAALGHHWTGGKNAYIPNTDTARLGIKLAEKTIDLIKTLKPKYWYIENPRGLLRKMPFMQEFTRHTVTYCQYGDKRMKPTDVWTNNPNWIPRPACKNGSPCHEAAPRGSKTGTQGVVGAYNRSKIPHELCLEVMQACKQ
jgi:hypothetical protein